MSYLYIGDCLSDLGKLRPAIEAYREVAWRYENEPAAVSATMQVVSCYQRLGQGEEARAALARLQWLLNKIPAAAFDTQRGMSSRAYWQAMAQRIEKITPY
jgi:TolA-binding protein